jgi:branched-chain amino acid transport system substrate-binding protein
MRYRILCTSLLLVIAAGTAAAGDLVSVGVVLPLSGHTANFGTEALRGINLAVETVNANGGVRNRKLHLIVRDNASDPAQTSVEVSDLVTEEGVIAVVGPVTSTCAAAAAAVAQAAGTPLVLPTATTPFVTEIGEYVTRICFTDPFQSKVLAEFSRQTLQVDRVAIIYEIGSSYSENLAEFYAMQFEEMGGEIVFQEGVGPSADQLRKAVDQALAEGPHVLFAPMYYPEAAVIVNRVHELESPVTLLGGDGWESTELLRLAGANISSNKVYISSHFSMHYPMPHVASFVERFQQTYGEAPNAVSALGYDAIMVLADALRRATTTDRHGLQQALIATNDFAGVTGTITINEKRNVIKDVFILKVEQDRFEHETAIPAY